MRSVRTYLDYNATTPLDEAVAETLAEAQRQFYGNPSSVHAEGRKARKALEEARAAVASFIGCEAGEVVFTSSGTEANHIALRSAALGRDGRRRVLISAVEHPSVAAQRPFLEAAGYQVEEIPVTGDGYVDTGALEHGIGDDVAVVSVMTAHNETGVLQPLEKVSELCVRTGALFHTDAVQAAGKVPLSWRGARPDYLVIAAHKFYGPKGIAAVAVRRGSPVAPMLVGGGQESGIRASTEAVPLAVAMAEACRRVDASSSQLPATEKMRDEMETVLTKKHSAFIYGKKAKRLPNTSFFSIPGRSSKKLVKYLDEKGFAISAGSACHGKGGGCPLVLKMMGFAEDGLSALRVSLGRNTTTEEIEAFLEALKQT